MDISPALTVLLSADTVRNAGNDSSYPRFIDEDIEAQTCDGATPGLTPGALYGCFQGAGPQQGKAGQTRRCRFPAGDEEAVSLHFGPGKVGHGEASLNYQPKSGPATGCPELCDF